MLVRDPDWRVVVAAAVAMLAVWCAIALGEEPKTRQEPAQEATRCVCEWPANGAAVGESLEKRQARLETALRLTKAERVVNRSKSKPAPQDGPMRNVGLERKAK